MLHVRGGASGTHGVDGTEVSVLKFFEPCRHALSKY